MKFNKTIVLLCALISSSAYASISFGENPALNLVTGGNNVFYGIANNDGTGTSGSGAVYSWNASSNTYAAVAANIPNIVGSPVVASDGSIYVLSSQGGSDPNGALYHIVNGVATPVHVFTNTSGEGANPNFITMVPDGRIYGTTYKGGYGGYGTIFVYNPKDNSFSSPQSFSGADGGYPQGLVYTNGYLYGVTQWGGANGVGALYKWDYINDGAITVLHSFSKNNDLNGPQTELSLSNDGNTLMGTTFYNGNDWGGGTFAYNIPSNSYNIVWYGNYYQATPPVQAQDGTWYQSAVSTDDHWDILAFHYTAGCPKGFSWDGANCASSINLNNPDDKGWGPDVIFWQDGGLYISGSGYNDRYPVNCPNAGSGPDFEISSVPCNILTASDVQKYNIGGYFTWANDDVYLSKALFGFPPTVVYSGTNSSPDFKNDGINGLAYNSSDNSLIATQQWGGANSLGYINKFTANGLNSITGNDVYNFIGASPSDSCANDAQQIYAFTIEGNVFMVDSKYYLVGIIIGGYDGLPDFQEQNGVCRNGGLILSTDQDGNEFNTWVDTSCYWGVGNWKNTLYCAY
jgi:uncharacterized repeat protein (TIGR03803 family)